MLQLEALRRTLLPRPDSSLPSLRTGPDTLSGAAAE